MTTSASAQATMVMSAALKAMTLRFWKFRKLGVVMAKTSVSATRVKSTLKPRRRSVFLDTALGTRCAIDTEASAGIAGLLPRRRGAGDSRGGGHDLSWVASVLENSATIDPAATTIIRSRIARISGRSEEIMSTGKPRAASSGIRWCTWALVPKSIPWVGSSRTRTLGSVASHLASTAFCLFPPEMLEADEARPAEPSEHREADVRGDVQLHDEAVLAYAGVHLARRDRERDFADGGDRAVALAQTVTTFWKWTLERVFMDFPAIQGSVSRS